MSEYIETPRYGYGQGTPELTMASPSPTGAPRIGISTETDLPPAYDEARNRNLAARNPSNVPSLHTPSIIDLAHRPAEHTDAGRLGGAFDGPDIMPSLSMLAQPSELFPDAAPYYMMLTCVGPTARISGSHQPSLRLIAEYFKRWGRTSPPKPGQPPNSGHPLLEVKIFGSRFSQRDYVDVAVITTKLSQDERQVPKGLDVNPAMIVGFVQGVLGYRIMHISEGGVALSER